MGTASEPRSEAGCSGDRDSGYDFGYDFGCDLGYDFDYDLGDDVEDDCGQYFVGCFAVQLAFVE